MRRFCLLCLLLCAGISAQAQPRLEAPVRAYLAPYADAGEFSGVALVLRGDSVLASVGVGDAAAGKPATPATRFRLGSVTKAFTSAALLRLVAQGRVALGASVCAYLTPCPDAWQAVTIRHLLSHTAGIPNYTALPDYPATQAVATTPAALMARVSNLPLQFAPGTQFAYSNSGYVVLGRVLEAVTGQPYAAALRTLVLQPLGIPGVYVGDAPEGEATGYGPNGTGRVPAAAVDMTVPYAAGALVATSAEVAAFARGVFRGDFLPDSLRTAALTPVQGVYGLGWVTAPLGPGRSASHGGNIDGFASFLAYRLDADVAVVVLANVERAPAQKIALDLVRMAAGQAVPPPTIRRAVTLSESDLNDVVGTYRMAPTFALTVRRTPEGGVEVQATGQGALPVYAEARDRFFSRAVDAQFSFERDADGRVVRLVLHQGGRDQPAVRE